MATQYAPIAKDSSINITEQTPRNIADVLAEELSAIEQAIAGGSGSGGHTIVNASGTDMTQRAKMQFVDAKVTDDAVNDVTKISTTPASYPSANVTYGSGSVEDALDDLTGYGTNTNGTYYKFIDGTLICTKAFETNISISTTWGALYETSAPISFGDWAHSFISAPIASLTVAGEGLACVPERLSGVTASSAGNSFFFRPTSGTGVLTANLIAIGRWK